MIVKRQKTGGTGPLKECPNCHSMVGNFLRICPHCEYEFADNSNFDFGFGGKAPSPEQIDLEFGEFLSHHSHELMKYARQQRRARATNFWHPDGLWTSFHKRYPGEFLVEQWLIGAVFGGEDSPKNRNKFLEYLEICASQFKRYPSQSWFQHHLEIEFGKPGQKYRVGSKNYKPNDFGETTRQNWWEVLGVSYGARKQEVKRAYVDLAKKYHPDSCPEDISTEEAKRIMQRINLAYEQFKNINNLGS